MHLGTFPLSSAALCALLLAPVSTPARGADAGVPWYRAVGPEWRSVDDPDADGVPDPLVALPGEREAVFASVQAPRLLLVRAVGAGETPFDVFMADEEAMNRKDEFIPLEDHAVSLGDREAYVFDCEWRRANAVLRVCALYAPPAEGKVRSLWLVTAETTAFPALEAELVATLERSASPPPDDPDSYSGLLLGHRVTIPLRLASPSPEATNAPVLHLRHRSQGRAEDAEFIEAIAKANPDFATAIVRQWADDDAGVSLSYQVFTHDTNLGPPKPFVHWLAGVFQEEQRGDPDLGDVPIELMHLPRARTRVVDEETVRRHYANNERAPEAGVILKVFLPKSPFARVCDLGWTEEGAEGVPAEHRWVRFVELRDYRRSRSETITRVCVLFLSGRARTREGIDILRRGLRLTTEPLDEAQRFPLPQ